MTREEVSQATMLVSKIKELESSIIKLENMLLEENISKGMVISNVQVGTLVINSANNELIINFMKSTLEADLAALETQLQEF